MTKPPANVLALPLEERAEMALRGAVEKVIVEHARQGLPIYIWREGRVVELSRVTVRGICPLASGINIRSLRLTRTCRLPLPAQP